MKKLKLKAMSLGTDEVLTREQLKNVLGGDGSGSLASYGTCFNNPGCWSYTNPVPWTACAADLERYCVLGEGECSASYVCY